MNNMFPDNVSEKTLNKLKTAVETAERNSIELQRQEINSISPYSCEINESFGSYNEFYYLYNLGLKEAFVTRKALIKEIDLDLYIKCEGKTNRELMLSGKPPYTHDDENCQVMLHHIGQKYDAPFAELTHEEHLMHGNNLLLHNNVEESWRNTNSLEKEFNKEREKYWIKRAKLDYEILCIVCAMDNYGNSVARIAGLGSPTAKRIENALLPALDKEKVECIYSDAELALRSFAVRNGFKIKQVKTKNIKRNYKTYQKMVYRRVQKINSYHSRLRRFLTNFNGISSQLLPGYLYLFSWKERSKSKEMIEAYKELLRMMLKPNLYKSVKEIECEKVLPDAFEIEREFKHKVPFRDLKRIEDIYRRYADGETQVSIAKSLGVSHQAINSHIVKFRKSHMAYKTKMDIEKEEKASLHDWLADENKKKHYRNVFNSYYALYLAKENWTGSDEDFYKEFSEKTGFKTQTLKNWLITVKRVLALQEAIYANEFYEYRTLEEKGQDFRNSYLKIKEQFPDYSKYECANILAEEFNYTFSMTIAIISRIERKEPLFTGQKTPVSETTNRDKKMFVDILNWRGTKDEFMKYAKEKYNLKQTEIYRILRLICMAEPKRFDMMKLD